MDVRLARIVVEEVLPGPCGDPELELRDAPRRGINAEVPVDREEVLHGEIDECCGWTDGEGKREDCMRIVASHQSQEAILLFIANQLISLEDLNGDANIEENTKMQLKHISTEFSSKWNCAESIDSALGMYRDSWECKSLCGMHQ